MFIHLSKNSNKRLSANFMEAEFYSTSPNAPARHIIDSRLVDAAQLLRTHFGTAWRITSTFRTHAHELALARREYAGQPDAEAKAQRLAVSSQHIRGTAFDSQPAGDASTNARIMAELHADFDERGPIWRALRKLGITGFGVYNTFIHLDTRTGPFAAGNRDASGPFAFWDNRKNYKKKAVARPMLRTKPTPTRPITLPLKQGSGV